jgi:hypothetical protein
MLATQIVDERLIEKLKQNRQRRAHSRVR